MVSLRDIVSHYKLLVKINMIYIKNLKESTKNLEYLKPLENLDNCNKSIRFKEDFLKECFKDVDEEVMDYYKKLFLTFDPWQVVYGKEAIPMLFKKLIRDGIIK